MTSLSFKDDFLGIAPGGSGATGAGSEDAMVWGVPNGVLTPFTARFLTQVELRDVIDTFNDVRPGLVPASTGANLSTDYLRADGLFAAPVGSGTEVNAFDPIEDATAYPDTAPYAVPVDQRYNKHVFFTNDAANHFVEFAADMSVDPAAFGRFTAPPSRTLGLLKPLGGSINGSAAAGPIWTVPPGGSVDWLVRASDAIAVNGDFIGPLNLYGSEVYGNLSPFQTATGSQASAASGRSWKLTGNITALPITNGWHATYLNDSATLSRTITPPTGAAFLVIESGTLLAANAIVTVGARKMVTVHADGTNLIVAGDIA